MVCSRPWSKESRTKASLCPGSGGRPNEDGATDAVSGAIEPETPASSESLKRAVPVASG